VTQPGAGTPGFRSAIVNESLAAHYFGTQSPIGARIGLGDQPDTRTTIEIVGVVKTFSYSGIRETEDQLFLPLFEGAFAGAGFWVRSRVPATSMFGSIRATIGTIDPALPVLSLRTLDDQIDRTLVNERLMATLASGFAGLALLLAIVGVYGVTAFTVSRRTREIGIRMALGATRARTVRLVLREGLTLLVGGVAIALPVARALGGTIQSELFGVRPMDWRTLLGAAFLITLAALAAIAVPVRRATSISPMDALRGD
jgi:ABC-type antimicrobial peptide transport system permease subunit